MKKQILLGSTLLVFTNLMWASYAQASFTEIKPNTVKIDGVKYWRAKADEATLGSVGRKRNNIGSANFFEKMQDAPSGIFKVTVGATYSISSKQARSLGVKASVSNGAVKASGSASKSDDNQAAMSIYKMSINLGNKKGDLRKETNANHKHLTAMKELGDKARLISSVWIMVEGNESQSSCYSGDLSVSDTTDSYSIGVSASGCKSSEFTIPAGAIVAYDMVKVKKWDNQEITVRPSCKKNYKLNISSSAVNPMDSCENSIESDSGVRCSLSSLDKRENWYVSQKSGRDICESKKGKKPKSVECVHKEDKYLKLSGKDKCVSTEIKTANPSCPAGYDYNKKSSKNNGADMCELRGIHMLSSDIKGS